MGRLVAIAVALAAAAAAASAAPTAELGSHVVLRKSLQNPTALAFSPRDGSLWIVNDRKLFDSTTIVTGVGTRSQRARVHVDYGRHYLRHPTGIAFSPSRPDVATSALAGGGPTLWLGDRRRFRGSIESHIDMVHLTEPALGIAAGADDAAREYWVVDGANGGIDRYFFNEPHPPGAQDHRDGVVYRYASGMLRLAPNVPAGIAFDRATGTIYVADTGNGRIVSWVPGPVPGNAVQIGEVPGQERLFAAEARPPIETFVNGLAQPSALALANGRLYVGERGTGRIRVFTLDGRLVRSIDTRVGRNALGGIAVTARGTIYALDSRRSLLLRF